MRRLSIIVGCLMIGNSLFAQVNPVPAVVRISPISGTTRLPKCGEHCSDPVFDQNYLEVLEEPAYTVLLYPSGRKQVAVHITTGIEQAAIHFLDTDNTVCLTHDWHLRTNQFIAINTLKPGIYTLQIIDITTDLVLFSQEIRIVK